MDEDWRNTFEFFIWPLGQDQEGVAPKGPKFILYKHNHIAHQIEGYEEQNIVVQKFCLAGKPWGP